MPAPEAAARPPALRAPGVHSGELLQDRLGVADLELRARLDVQLFHHAVLDEHREAPRAHAHAVRREIELEAELLREVGVAVAEEADLAERLFGLTPRGHHEAIVRGDAPYLVDVLRLQLVEVLDEA